MEKPKRTLQDSNHSEHLSKDVNESNSLHKDESEEDFVTNKPRKRRNLHIASGALEADLTIISSHTEGAMRVIDKVKLNSASVVRVPYKS